MADKDDRPGGMLEISPALERDMDKAAAGKIPAPPLEAFMSDAALQEAQDATDRAAAPVHAEDLTPISPAEAAARRTQHGESLPSMPVMRKVIPPPFRRPSVTGGSHGKRWQPVRASQVRKDDIITDLGLVTDVGERTVYRTRREILGLAPDELDSASPRPVIARQFSDLLELWDLDEKIATGTEIVVTGAGGTVRVFRPDAQVRVFRKA